MLLCARFKTVSLVYDNTKPSARMGRKAHRVSTRQPGCRNTPYFGNPAFLLPLTGAREEVISRQAARVSWPYARKSIFLEERMKKIAICGCFALIVSMASNAL